VRVLLHATLFSSWVLILVAQTALVSAGRTAVHRRLGVVGAVVAAIMTVSGPPLAAGLARRGNPTGTDPLVVMLRIATAILLFGVLGAIALYWRRRPEIHKRLMLLATVNLLAASVVRWPVAETNPAPFVSGVFLAFILAMVVHDIVTRRRPHLATVVGGL